MQGGKKSIKGRGAQSNPDNVYLEHAYTREHPEGIDECPDERPVKTEYIEVFPRTILNKVDSPDIGPGYSMNPYQGCEHGCIYCYARNSHQYWGFSAGLDFERKILVKPSAPYLLEEKIRKPNWKATPIMLSGNTDCYQPIEQKLEITRKILEIMLKYRHPVGIITKNDLVLRDLDLLEKLADMHLVVVNISITSLDERLRRKLEPRTATYKRRLETVKQLSDHGVPVNVMMAPVIPSLTSHEIFEVAKQTAAHGARSIAHTVLRLNGHLGDLFEEWIRVHLPDMADRILNQVRECHDGKLNDSRFGIRIQGDGKVARQIKDMVEMARKKYFAGKKIEPLDCNAHALLKNSQLNLFGS